MAYGTKSKFTRRYARKGRGKVAKLAKGKTSSVQALAKAVSNIQRSLRTHAEYLNYGQKDVLSLTVQPGDAINLNNYYGFTDLFGSSVNDSAQNKIIHKSFGMDFYLTLDNTIAEPDTTQFTIFLVSLKDEIGYSYNSATGALGLTAGQHYVMQGGLVLLNKKMFNIHKIKRTVLTNHGTSISAPSAQTQGGTDLRWYWKFSPNKMITNPVGDWKQLSCAQDPSKQYYVLIFNDNSSLDLQNPKLHYNIVHTLKTVA